MRPPTAVRVDRLPPAHCAPRRRAPDPHVLASFYSELLGWPIGHHEPGTAAVAEAVALGAMVATTQPQENVRVLLDPAGHPFCLCHDEG
jgi:hypothetical protein